MPFVCHLCSLITCNTTHCGFLNDTRHLSHQLPNYLTLNELISEYVCDSVG